MLQKTWRQHLQVIASPARLLITGLMVTTVVLSPSFCLEAAILNAQGPPTAARQSRRHQYAKNLQLQQTRRLKLANRSERRQTKSYVCAHSSQPTAVMAQGGNFGQATRPADWAAGPYAPASLHRLDGFLCYSYFVRIKKTASIAAQDNIDPLAVCCLPAGTDHQQDTHS